MEKKQNVPELRFQGFSGEWEKNTVGKIFEVTRGETLAVHNTSSTQNSVMNYPVYSSQTKNNGLMGYYSKYLFENAITWTTDGANAGTVRFRKGKFYCTNVCGVLLSKQGYANTFMAETLNKVAWKHVSKVGNPKLMNNVMKEICIYVPGNIEEQNKLAVYLEELDLNIFNRVQKIQKLQQFRQAMMAKLFPREGAAEPELRFRGFSGKWVSRSFEELFSLLPTNNLARSDLNSEYGKIRDIHYGDILIKYNDLINVADKDLPFISLNMEVKTNALLRDGDIVIADTAEDMTVGKCVEIVNVGRESVVSGLHTIACRPLEPFAAGFLGYFFNSHLYHNQLIPLMQGIKVTSISKNALKDTVVYFPSEFNEQKKIGQFFKELDSFISLQQKKLKRMQRLKAALLEKMFV